MPKLLKNLYNEPVEKARGRFVGSGATEKAFLCTDYRLIRTWGCCFVTEDA
jgi:hypothetical protein